MKYLSLSHNLRLIEKCLPCYTSNLRTCFIEVDHMARIERSLWIIQGEVLGALSKKSEQGKSEVDKPYCKKMSDLTITPN